MDRRLKRLLEEIIKGEHGVYSADDAAGLARGTFSRWTSPGKGKKPGKPSVANLRILAAHLGEKYHFTEREVLIWGGHLTETSPGGDGETGPDLPPDIRFAYRDAARYMPPEELEALLDVIRHQFRTYTRSWIERERGASKYREPAPQP